MLGQRFNKACDSCHISKVRCVPDPLSPIGTCKRCTRNGNHCVFSPVGPRRRPMRTKNERIAELERRVKDMQLKLEKSVEKRATATTTGNATANANATADLNPASSSSDPDFDPANVTGSGSGPRSDSGSGSTPLLTANEPRSALASQIPLPEQPPLQHTARTEHAPTVSPPTSDVVERGLITPTQAEQLVREFRAKLHGKYLGICLPDGFSSDQLRRKRPAFWLSVLSAASASSLDLLPLAPMLFGELKSVLDARLVPDAEPDLDALQALMNYVSFHYDPVFPLGEQLLQTYRTAIAMAVQMAESSRIHNLPRDVPILEQDVTDEHVQLSRELLHWYWASFSLAIKSRSASMLRKTNLVEASLRVLQIAGTQNDMFLTEWIKMARIAADTVLALHKGHTQALDGLSDEARDEILDTFEKRRKKWLVECPFDLVNETLMLEYHYYVLLISEVVYPAGVADFRQRSQGLPPISPRASMSPSSLTATAATPTTADSSPPKPDQNFLAPYKIRYTRKCITAAHACLDLVTNPADLYSSASNSGYARMGAGSDDLLRRFGVLPYGRIFYALRFLLFLAHEVWKTGRYDLVDVGSLRIGAYIAALKRCLRVASAGGRYRTPSLWGYALRTRIEPWYRDLCALLERASSDKTTSRTLSEEGSEGEVTPRAGSSARAATEYDAATSRRTQDAPEGGDFFSPLLFDFPFEILSSGGTPSSLPRNARDPRDTSTTAATPQATNKPFPPKSISPISAPISRSPSTAEQQQQQQQQYVHAAAAPEPTLQNTSAATDLGSPSFGHNIVDHDLTASLEDMDIYTNVLDFNWGDFGDIFPGSDMFLSPFPPLTGESPPEMMLPRNASSGSPLHLQGHVNERTGDK